jgi:hypothetical protein
MMQHCFRSARDREALAPCPARHHRPHAGGAPTEFSAAQCGVSIAGHRPKSVPVAEDGVGTIGPARGAIAAHPRYRPAIPPATEALPAPQVRRDAERSAAGMEIIAQGSPGDGERSRPVGRFWGILMVV